VRGTPSIVLPNGTLLPGYLPVDKLAKEVGL
jgi:thiol:disulfide interchange protein DsbC